MKFNQLSKLQIKPLGIKIINSKNFSNLNKAGNCNIGNIEAEIKKQGIDPNDVKIHYLQDKYLSFEHKVSEVSEVNPKIDATLHISGNIGYSDGFGG